MSTHPFDFDEVFGDDYLYFYEGYLDDARTAHDVEVISSLISMKPGIRVLDLACGHGRIANPLAERGAHVVGLDSTPHFLERARKDAAERGVDVEYVHGDMRSLPWDAEFDAVVNWFTAFGYFSETENRSVLLEVHKVLKPGGCVVIDHLNRDRVLKVLQDSFVTERDGDFLIDRHSYHAADGYMDTERISVRGGDRRRYRFSVRTFTLPELSDWLRAAGFHDVQGFNEDGEAYTLDGRRMVVRATK